jgi:hypothetical protein
MKKIIKKSKVVDTEDAKIRKERQELTKTTRKKRVKYTITDPVREEQTAVIELIYILRKQLRYPFNTNKKDLLKHSISDLKKHAIKLVKQLQPLDK